MQPNSNAFARVVLVVTTVIVLTASTCGGGPPSDVDTCASGGAGALQVTIRGLPPGVLAAVTVTGSDFSQTVTTSDTLNNLDGGSYTVAAEYVAAPDTVVRTAYRPSVSNDSLCIKDAQTESVTVVYGAVPSSGKLWVSGSSGTAGANKLRAFSSDTLGTPATVEPSVVLTTTPSVTSPKTVAFDKEGNLWVVDTAGTLKRFPANALGLSGEKSPDVIIGGDALDAGVPGPRSLAFDREGNLWVSISFSDKVLKYAANQLASSGEPIPAVEISALDGPTGIAFDDTGNLWLTSAGEARVVRYNASRLNASTADPPDLVIEAKSTPPVVNTLGSPVGLAFDTAGNLWVAYFGPNVIARFTSTDLSGVGTKTLTPEVQITLGVTVLLTDLAFDESGHLWTAYSQGKLGRLTPAQLTSSGTKTPEVVITSSSLDLMRYAEGLAFYPAPVELPLYHQLP